MKRREHLQERWWALCSFFGYIILSSIAILSLILLCHHNNTHSTMEFVQSNPSTSTEPLQKTACRCVEESAPFKCKQCCVWHAVKCPCSFMKKCKEHTGYKLTISIVFVKCMTYDALVPIFLPWSINFFITWGFCPSWRKRITWVTKVNVIYVDIATCIWVDCLWSRFIGDDQRRKDDCKTMWPNQQVMPHQSASQTSTRKFIPWNYIWSQRTN